MPIPGSQPNSQHQPHFAVFSAHAGKGAAEKLFNTIWSKVADELLGLLDDDDGGGDDDGDWAIQWSQMLATAS